MRLVSMSRVDELFSKYGRAGKVEVNNSSYESPLFRKERKKQIQKKQAKPDRRIEMPAKEEIERNKNRSFTSLSQKIDDTKLKLAFAFQSTGWHGSLLDRLNTFSYLDLYKKRISKVRSKTADITDVIEDIEGKVRDGR
tara:strand:+ start:647 stop:1063 length:417 start_codon:yes stop_codon:yes gene_type:complete